MVSNASLNHVYRTVWNASLGAMVAVAEISTGRGKSSGGPSRSAGAAHGTALRVTLSALAIALAWGAGQHAIANPAGGVAIHGQATMTSSGNALTVTTQNGAGTNHSAINWQSFSIPAGSSTYFNQPSQTSTVINRVVTATPSAIFGTLGSNGNVVLINQSGITVGAGAVVDTAGFTASALRMSDADALAGRLRVGGTDSVGGDVNVQGSILARSGDVVLVGANVSTGQQALIQAPNGSTILAAGQQVEITGRGLEGISLQVQAPDNSAVNLGTLKGDAVGIFASTLKHSGAIAATAVTTAGGKVVLKAAETLSVDGSVLASATQSRGGSVQATAKKVLIKAGAVLDASGDLGGGEVLVGGGFKGQDARVSNAQTTLVESGAQLKADARVNGDGGQVVVWADGLTRYAGNLSAQGGAQGGNGGNAEVSGKKVLDFRGTANLKAVHGKRGTLLLDPNNLYVSTGSMSVQETDEDGAIENSQIAASFIENLLNGFDGISGADVALSATNDITVIAAITYSSVDRRGLSMTSEQGSINVNAEIQSDVGAGALDLNLKARNAINVTHTLTTRGGNVKMTAATIDAKDIITKGVPGTYSDGTDGGDVELRSKTAIAVGAIDASGGNGANSTYGDGYRGGKGGAVKLLRVRDPNTTVAGVDDLTLATLNINTSGGTGGSGYGSGYGGGVGGNAGDVYISAANGKLVLNGGVIKSNGGAGGGTGQDQGSGGSAGSLEIGVSAVDSETALPDGIDTTQAAIVEGYEANSGTTKIELTGNLALGALGGDLVPGTVSLKAGDDGITQAVGTAITGLTENAVTGAVKLDIESDGPVNLASSLNKISHVSVEGLTNENTVGGVSVYGVDTLGDVLAQGDLDIRSNATLTLDEDVNSGGGKINLKAANDIVKGDYHSKIDSTGSLYGGTAGDVTIEATTGNIDLRQIVARGQSESANIAVGNGGSVKLTAGGTVTLSGAIDSRGGDGSSPRTAGGTGGDVTVEANGAGQSVSTLAGVFAMGGLGGGNILPNDLGATGAGGEIEVTVSHNLELPGDVASNAKISIVAVGDITQQTPTCEGTCESTISNAGSYGSSAPIVTISGANVALMTVKSDGDISISATGTISTGDTYEGSSLVRSYGGNIFLSGTSVTLDEANSTTEGRDGKVNGGNITVTATTGNIQLSHLNTQGEDEMYGGGKGGNVVLTAATDVAVNNTFDVTGGDGTLSSNLKAGGAAGNITVTAGTTLNIGASIEAGGGQGGAGFAGGNGGNVTLTANGASSNPPVSSFVHSVSAGGGSAGYGATILTSQGGDLVIHAAHDLNVGSTLTTTGRVELFAAGALNAGAINNKKDNSSATPQNIVLRSGTALAFESILSDGNVALVQDTGDLNFSYDSEGDGFAAASVNLNATAGSITQDKGIQTGLLTTVSKSGTTLQNSNNVVTELNATNSTSGDIAFNNGENTNSQLTPTFLNIRAITNNGGAVIVEGWGGVETTGLIKASVAPPASAANGGVTIKTHSPLTVGAPGISASGNIVLEAMTDSISSNIVLNGGLSSSGGGISVNAANAFTQNSFITAAAGVSVGAGSISYGPNATTVGSPVSYTAAGVSVAPPPTSLASSTQDAGTTNTDVLTAFVNNYDEALAAQEADNNNPFGKKKSDIVVEGEICAP